MKGDLFLPMTSSSSEPSSTEDAPLRDQPRPSDTELHLYRVSTGREVSSLQPRQSLPSSDQCEEQRDILLPEHPIAFP